MVATNGIHSNGNGHITPAYPACPSDYGPRPTDVTPKPAVPGWCSQWPEYTHNVSWVDSDSKQHSLTIRTDDLDELLVTLTALKHVIRASKQKAVDAAPQSEQPADMQHCEIHGVDMPRRWSKRTQGHYFGHKVANSDFCYGKTRA